MKKRLVRVLVVMMMMVCMCTNAYAANNVSEERDLSDKEIVAKYIELDRDYDDTEFASVEIRESAYGEEYIGYILYDEDGNCTYFGSVLREYAVYVIERQSNVH